MAVITNTNVTTDYDKVNSIDFVERFGQSIGALADMLGVTRKIPVAEGFKLKRYEWTNTIVSGVVSEGDEIPLSKVEREEAAPIVITLDKHRRLVTAEAIQQSGYELAVTESDNKLLAELQKAIRTQFLALLATGTGTGTGTDFQAALANAWGIVTSAFADDAVQVNAFVNPLDIAGYLGSTQAGLASAFGMSYLENFQNTRTIVTPLVPTGTIYATAAENISLAYIDVNTSDMAKAFPMVTDSTGYIGLLRDPVNSRLSSELVTVSGIVFNPEVLAGIAKVEIAGAPSG